MSIFVLAATMVFTVRLCVSATMTTQMERLRLPDISLLTESEVSKKAAMYISLSLPAGQSISGGIGFYELGRYAAV